MNGHMDGWMGGWMDLWTYGCMEGWIDWWMDGSIGGYVCGWQDGLDCNTHIFDKHSLLYWNMYTHPHAIIYVVREVHSQNNYNKKQYDRVLAKNQ